MDSPKICVCREHIIVKLSREIRMLIIDLVKNVKKTTRRTLETNREFDKRN
jgi:hypothetical protein